MLIRDQDLLSLRMIATDGSAHAVTDVLVREDGLEAAYVIADIGSWLVGRRVRVGIGRFDPPDVAARSWRAAIGARELEERSGEAGGGGLSLFQSASGERGGREADWRDDDGPLRSVAAMAQGVHVDAEDGRAGKLMGLIFETDDWSARHLVIETGDDGLPKNQRVVPADLVDAIDWREGAVRLKLSRERLRESPDLHEIDGLEGKWYNKVLAYYGLQS